MYLDEPGQTFVVRLLMRLYDISVLEFIGSFVVERKE